MAKSKKQYPEIKTGKLSYCYQDVDNGGTCSTHFHEPVKLDSAASSIAADIESPNSPYTKKRVLYHYACPDCSMPFEPMKTESEMDAQVVIHDCENLTDFEAYKVRKVLKSQMGYTKWYEATCFSSEHSQCVSYQTACTECAEKHELKLYELYTFNEMSKMVRPDSMFYKPHKNDEFLDLPDIPERWQYLPNKSGMQLELERKGINFGDHYDEETGSCKICGGPDSDMYCMGCWTPSGYLDDEAVTSS